MRSMRLKNREIKDQETLRELIDDCVVVRIGAMDKEGMFIVPVNYGYEWEDIKDSAEFENAAIYYTAGKPPRGKYFKSWKDYQQHHVVKVKNQPNTTPKKLAEEKKEANTKDEAYMYYI